MFVPPTHFAPFVFCGPGCGGGGDGVHCDNNYNSAGDHLYRNYAGYYKSTVPAIGSSITANVEMYSSHITSTGVATAAWTGVDEGTSPDRWMQSGVALDSSGPYKYIEWSDGTTRHLTSEGSAAYRTSYSVTITHVSNGVWKATIGGSPWIQTSTLSGTMTGTQTTTESQEQNPNVSCNGVDAIVTSMNPARNTMTSITEIPDFVENVGAATFEGVQGQQGS